MCSALCSRTPRPPWMPNWWSAPTPPSAKRARPCWPPEHELLLYVLHGALHLVGFRDHEPARAHRDACRRGGLPQPAGSFAASGTDPVARDRCACQRGAVVVSSVQLFWSMVAALLAATLTNLAARSLARIFAARLRRNLPPTRQTRTVLRNPPAARPRRTGDRNHLRRVHRAGGGRRRGLDGPTLGA